MSGFRVGDVCVIVRSERNPQFVGCEVTVVGELETYTCMDDGREHEGHEVEGPCLPYSDEWANMLAPHELRLKRPPEDPFAAGDWELCPWRPGKKTQVPFERMAETIALIRRFRGEG